MKKELVFKKLSECALFYSAILNYKKDEFKVDKAFLESMTESNLLSIRNISKRLISDGITLDSLDTLNYYLLSNQQRKTFPEGLSHAYTIVVDKCISDVAEYLNTGE